MTAPPGKTNVGLSEVPAAAVASRPTLIRGLSLLDSVLLLVGGIIGSAIFLTAKDVAGPLPRPALFVLVWVVGGALTLIACFASAELAAMFPDSGGPYVYLREAYGSFVAFLYGWMIFTVSNGGTIAALAVGFATYLGAVVPAISGEHAILAVAGWSLTRAHLVAIAAIALLTWSNVIGLRRGAVVQNIATWAKFAAIALFVILGVTAGKGAWSHFSPQAGASPFSAHGSWGLMTALGIALIAVFWAYDGWVYITWVAGEVKQPQRNLPRALVLGVAIVAAIYIAINVVYLYALPITVLATEETPAHAAARALFSPAAAVWLSLMIAVSCFGAMASCVLSGGRVYFAMARDGLFFARMAEVHPRWRTPAFSLIAQGVWSGILALTGKYTDLYTYVMFWMILSYVLTVAALFLLRWKRPKAQRPYRCTGYPILPALYLVLGTAWALNTAILRPWQSLAGVVIVLLGVPGYIYWKRSARVALLKAS